MKRALLLLVLLGSFIALRIDTSERTYFQVDDQVVVMAVDDATNHGNWQPDWYRFAQQSSQQERFASNATAHDIPHAHHYNFTMHMLLSAAIVKPLRLLGVTTPTIVLLHHIALLWEIVSLLFVVLAAARLGGNALALCSAVLYTVFPLAVQGAHYARPDALLTAMGSALLYFALCQASWSRSRWLLASGLALGIATGGKASQLMLGIIPAIASSARLLDRQQQQWQSLWKIATDGIALLVIVGGVLGAMFAAGNIAPQDFWLSILSVQQYYQHPDPPDLLEHYSYLIQLGNILHYFVATLGWLWCIALLVGTAALAQRKDKRPAILLAAPLAFFMLYFASVPAFFDRSFTALSSAIVLLAATGITAIAQRFSTHTALPVIVSLLVSWQPIVIQYHLQTDHLREHHNEDRLAFQRQLKENLSKKYGQEFWIKSVDRQRLFSQTLPEILPGNPRIYAVEDLNDVNSQRYLQKLRDNGFEQIAEFRGDFADMPTNSLIIVHEAARTVYFIQHPDGALQ